MIGDYYGDGNRYRGVTCRGIKTRTIIMCGDAVLIDTADAAPDADDECSECGGAGVVDSGGVTPWGTGIGIECPACHGTGQDDPPPGYYHGKCPACGGSGWGHAAMGD